MEAWRKLLLLHPRPQTPLLSVLFAGVLLGPEIISSNPHDGDTTQEYTSFAIRPHPHRSVKDCGALWGIPLTAETGQPQRIPTESQLSISENILQLPICKHQRLAPRQKNDTQKLCSFRATAGRIPALLGPAFFRGPGRARPWLPVAPHGEHGTAARVCDKQQSLGTIL